MQKNNVHEALYLNLEIMITWSEVQTIAMGQYDRKIKNIVVMSMKASF